MALVRALAAGERTLPELATTIGGSRAELEAKLVALVDAGLAHVFRSDSPPLPAADRERFSRQLPYLAELGEPAQLQRELRRINVLVIGTGGLGSWIVASLSAMGVGGFTLVDPDVVELSNLNRQILFGTASVGAPKVDATARWIRQFDESIQVTCVQAAVSSAEQVASLLPGIDLVVLSADWPPHDISCWVNEACMAGGVPFVTAGQHLPIVRVGPAYVPGRTACFACHASQLRSAYPLYDEYIAHVRHSARPDATLGSTSGIAGTMVATDAVRLLLTGSSETAGSALILDVNRFDIRRESLTRDPSCVVCQHLTAWQPRTTRSV